MSEDERVDSEPTGARLARAYKRMLERARAMLEQETTLKSAVETARQNAVEFGELTREEADQISYYVRRDLHDAGEYLSRTGREFREWAQIDLSMAEQGLVDLFMRAADRTRLEFEAFARELKEGPPYHSGEMTGAGTLSCQNCGQTMNFHGPAHIPPCPKCRGKVFRRVTDEG